MSPSAWRRDSDERSWKGTESYQDTDIVSDSIFNPIISTFIISDSIRGLPATLARSCTAVTSGALAAGLEPGHAGGSRALSLSPALSHTQREGHSTWAAGATLYWQSVPVVGYPLVKLTGGLGRRTRSRTPLLLDVTRKISTLGHSYMYSCKRMSSSHRQFTCTHQSLQESTALVLLWATTHDTRRKLCYSCGPARATT